MTRYWFKFEGHHLPPGVNIGCGVTAHTYQDAINILQQKVFLSTSIPPIKNCIENINITTLDEGHVIPNMLPPNERGIWYPIGY